MLFVILSTWILTGIIAALLFIMIVILDSNKILLKDVTTAIFFAVIGYFGFIVMTIAGIITLLNSNSRKNDIVLWSKNN